MERLTLYQEYRLIERLDCDINGAWKGMHLLLFFLAFVFGSFCTFCFHMLMYLFDEKCVLFPKLLSLTSLRHNVIYEFIPEDKAKFDMLPVDFLSTQWMEKSACYLPTYVPLVSGICGLIWTTMFLMCSTGSGGLTGLQRSWRVLPPVFVFSLSMAGLCIYSSVMTHYGLQELCVKLGEITGSSTCSYTVNVATLAYERQIRGVYQATRLTVFSAWLHTSCWIFSALLVLLRVLLAVDFQLVRVSVDLVGNIDTMLERHERHIRTVSPNAWTNSERTNLNDSPTHSTSKLHDDEVEFAEDIASLRVNKSDLLFFAEPPTEISELSLVPEERLKLSRIKAYQSIPKKLQFILRMVYDLVDNLDLPSSESRQGTDSLSYLDVLSSDTTVVARQFGREDIAKEKKAHDEMNAAEAKGATKYIKSMLHDRLNQGLIERRLPEIDTSNDSSTPSTSKKAAYKSFEESKLNLTEEMRRALQDKLNRNLSEAEKRNRKSNLKNMSSQTDDEKKRLYKSRKVKISDSAESGYSKSTGKPDNSDESSSDSAKEDKETQTKPKEKQD